MKFDADVIRKSTFSFTIEAETEPEAYEKAYDYYCKMVECNRLNEYLTDEDLDYEVAEDGR